MREWTSPNATEAVEEALRSDYRIGIDHGAGDHAVATLYRCGEAVEGLGDAIRLFGEAGHRLNIALDAKKIAVRRAKQARIKRRARKLRRGWR